MDDSDCDCICCDGGVGMSIRKNMINLTECSISAIIFLIGWVMSIFYFITRIIVLPLFIFILWMYEIPISKWKKNVVMFVTLKEPFVIYEDINFNRVG